MNCYVYGVLNSDRFPISVYFLRENLLIVEYCKRNLALFLANYFPDRCVSFQKL